MTSKLYVSGLILSLAVLGFSTFGTKRKALQTLPNLFSIDTLATDLTVPWEIDFLPDRTMIFTERSGKVRLFRNEKLVVEPALVITDIETKKKMGLLGLAVHPKFNVNRYVYLAHNYRKDENAFLRIVRYRLESDRLIDPLILLDGIHANQNHTGCRLKFGPLGKLYVTTGDADRPELAQDLTSLNGKILRINDDGSTPDDNPFAKNDTVRGEIWSYGHRNAQGLDFQPGTGFLYNSEHGPTGGDEINRIYKGANYGWPIIHHNQKKKGMFSPIVEYTPSIGPSDILFYDGDVFPSLKGSMLLACLRAEGLIRLGFNGRNIVGEEVLFKNRFGRIRALCQGPDGYIYFSTSLKDPPEGTPRPGSDLLLRLRPARGTNPGAPILGNGTRVSRIVALPMDKSPADLYANLCASCHGLNLEGTEAVPAIRYKNGRQTSNRKKIIQVITNGMVEAGMPAWEGALSGDEIKSLAEFIIRQAPK